MEEDRWPLVGLNFLSVLQVFSGQGAIVSICTLTAKAFYYPTEITDNDGDQIP